MRIYIILPLAISSLHISRDGSSHFAHAAERLEASASGLGKETQFQDILEKMKNDVLLFRDEVERVYSSRCDASTLENCAYNNYNSCSSTFPQQQCMKADELVISACGDGQSCNGELNEYIRLLLLQSAIVEFHQKKLFYVAQFFFVLLYLHYILHYIKPYGTLAHQQSVSLPPLRRGQWIIQLIQKSLKAHVTLALQNHS
jgi:hypothetical protein